MCVGRVNHSERNDGHHTAGLLPLNGYTNFIERLGCISIYVVRGREGGFSARSASLEILSKRQCLKV